MKLRALRSSRIPTALVALMFFAGCDSKSETSETSEKSETPKTETPGERGWSVKYSGGENGTISGKVSQITSVHEGLYVVGSDLKGNSMTVGLAVAPTDTGSYDAETFNITIDKELCEQQDAKPIKLLVTDGDKKSLAFTLSGTLTCEGKRGTLEIKGTFRKK